MATAMESELPPTVLGDVITFIRDVSIPGCLNTLLAGDPGIGKTRGILQAAEAAGIKPQYCFLSHPVLSDPSDLKGLAALDTKKGRATFLPFGEMARLLEVPRGERALWLIDDIGQATLAMQSGYMMPIEERMVGDRKLPDDLTIIAATNLRSNKANVQGLIEPIKSRFSTIFHVVKDVHGWVRVAIADGLPGEVVAYIQAYPDALHEFVPTTNMVNCPSPRTWYKGVGKIYQQPKFRNLSRELQYAALAGAVGQRRARDFTTFLELFGQVPDPRIVLTDPDRAPILEDPPGLQCALITGVAELATSSNFGNVVRYAERLQNRGLEELGALLIMLSKRKDPSIEKSASYARVCGSSMGPLLLAA